MAGVRILSKPQFRTIFSTAYVEASWMDKVKGAFTGKKDPDETGDFTLFQFADKMKTAAKVGKFKQYVVGRSSDATFSEGIRRQEAIIRCLGGFDPTGENLQTVHKQEAAKQCKCTIADVENALSKFTWAKGAYKKMQVLKEEGKPMPKNFSELQEMVGSTPLDLARSNLAKDGQISRNALCPCGSKKRYKRCCGKD